LIKERNHENSGFLSNLALNLGGVVDYRINHRFGWRMIQFDYNPIFARNRIVNARLFPIAR